MNTARNRFLWIVTLAWGVYFKGFLSAAPPEVEKVEPPSWWAGHSLNPVRLLIKGKNLDGAKVSAPTGFKISGIKLSTNGNWLFCDLQIPKSAKPGQIALILNKPDGFTNALFEILKPLPRPGRFQGFSPDDVLYLIMPDRFANGDPSNDDPAKSPDLFNRSKSRFYHGGDFQGIINHLPYLQDLGVTALWINPWYDNNDRLNEKERYSTNNVMDRRGAAITDYHGYGATDFYGVEEHLGNLPKLRELVEAAHARGIKVIQDQVANHTGPYHPWVTNSPTPTWFNGTAASHLNNTFQIWTVPDMHSSPALQRETLEGWFVNILPDLNQDDPECARYLIQNAVWWAGITGLDAIRQDTLPYVPRTFWHQWAAAIHKEFPKMTLLGEVFDGNVANASFFQGGRARFDGVDSGINSIFDFPLYYPVRRAFIEGQGLKQLATQLASDHLYVDPNILVTFLGLHDVNRFMNEKGATVAGLKLAYTFLFTTRGVPLIYYGDEIAMPGGTDPDNRRDFPGGWPGDPANAFEISGRTPPQQEVFSHLRSLAHLRRLSSPLRRGKLVNLMVTDSFYAYARVQGGECVIVAINNQTKPGEWAVKIGGLPLLDGTTLHDPIGGGQPVPVKDGTIQVSLPARSATILIP